MGKNRKKNKSKGGGGGGGGAPAKAAAAPTKQQKEGGEKELLLEATSCMPAAPPAAAVIEAEEGQQSPVQEQEQQPQEEEVVEEKERAMAPPVEAPAEAERESVAVAKKEEAPTAADPPVEAQAPAPAPPQQKQEKGEGEPQGEKEEAVSSVYGHLGPRSPPHLKPDVAKGFVQGGVLTLRLLEAESTHREKRGQAYTAYSFRVYWGPELLHAKGWSVRRRYREFVALDAKLRASFPEQACKLLPLPPKTYPALLSWFGGSGAGRDNRSPEVIAQRKQALESYLRHIVANIPPLLRSKELDDFLHITTRLERIKAMGGAGGCVSCPTSMQDDGWNVIAAEEEGEEAC